MRDPYEVLGVSKSAARPISRVLIGASRKLHPDANKHDPKAASHFAELNAAYEVVGDGDSAKHLIAERLTPKVSHVSRASKGSVRNRVVGTDRARVRISKTSASDLMVSVVRAAALAEASRISCAGCSEAAAAPRAARAPNSKMKISVRRPVQGRICTLR